MGDIDRAFDAVLDLEERFESEGQHDAVVAAQAASRKRGEEMGLELGRMAGLEMGYYSGFATLWLRFLDEALVPPTHRSQSRRVFGVHCPQRLSGLPFLNRHGCAGCER